MKSTLAMITATISATVLAADLYIGDGANDNTYTDNVSYSAATKIIKTGTGKTTISFGDTTPSFSGEIEVREGTLAVAQYPVNFGSPTKITVTSGATLDLTWLGNLAGNLHKAEIVIAGTGVGGAGAICRTNGGNINGLFGTVTLSDDALIVNSVQIGFMENTGIVNMNGHTLSVDAGSTVFYCPGTTFKDNDASTHGGLAILSGTFFPRYNAMTEGGEENVLTMSAGTTLRFRDLTSQPKWKIVTDGNVSFEGDKRGNTNNNTWNGPVEQGGTLTLSPQKNTFFEISGNISNAYPVKVSAASTGTTVLSGSNDVSTLNVDGGTLRIDGGLTTVHGSIMVTNGSTLAVGEASLFMDYEKMTAVCIGDKTEKTSKLVLGENCTMTSHNFGNPDGAAARLYVGRYSGEYGTMEVHDGAVVSNVLINIGESGKGALYQTGGSIYWPLRAADVLAEHSSAYGYYGIGGAFTMDASELSGGVFHAAWRGIISVAVRPGGCLDVRTSNRLRMALNASSRFVYYQDSGARSTFDWHFEIGSYGMDAGRVEVTVAGTNSELFVEKDFRLHCKNVSTHVAVNLNDGGTLATRYMYRDSETKYPWYFNINGGVIKPTLSGNNFAGSGTRCPTRTVVYENGFVIDTANTMTEDKLEYGTARMDLSFEAPPEGKRVVSIALPTDSGFSSETVIGPPVVAISGDGAGASAVALFDDETHVLTNIAVTSHGWGYTTATATLSGGGLANEYECAVTLEDQPETGWRGFTKRGAQRLDMYGVNTFKGDVTVEEGILGFRNSDAAQGGMPEGAGATVKEGAILTFTEWDTSVTVPFLAGSGTTSYGCFTVTNRIECTVADIFAGRHLTVDQNLTLTDGVKIVLTDPENLAFYRKSPSAVVVSCGETITANGKVSLEFATPCEDEDISNWRLSVKPSAIKLGYMNGMVILFR